MPMFPKRLPLQYRERTFSMPCSPSEAMDLLFALRDTNGNRLFGDPADAFTIARENNHPRLGKAPLAYGIFMADLSPDGFVIAAGNRVVGLWQMEMTFNGSNPTTGKWQCTYLEEPPFPRAASAYDFVPTQMYHMIERVVLSTSGNLQTWPTS